MSRAWPLTGLIAIVRRPALLGWPVLALLVSWAAVLALFTVVLITRRPPPDVGFLAALTGYLWALGLAGGAAVLLAMLLQPLLMAFALDAIARAQFTASGLPPATEEPPWRAVSSALRVVLNTIHLRLGAVTVAFLGPLIAGPFGLALAACAVAHVAILDAVDTALAVRGLDGLQRLTAIAAHRRELRGALATATFSNIGLSLTVLGWLLWLPSLVAGAASAVSTWPEVAAKPALDRPTTDDPTPTTLPAVKP